MAKPVDVLPAPKVVPLTVTKDELLEGQDDSAFREMVHNLLAFAARLEHVRSRFGAHIGLTGIRYTILITIRHLENNSGVGVKTVAGHLSLSGAFVTIETSGLLKLGLIEKRPNPIDRRRVLLTVSTRGRQLLSELSPVQQEINDVLFSPLDRKSFKALCRMSFQLRESAEKAVGLSNYLIAGQPRGRNE